MPKGGYKAGGGRPRQANSRRSLMEKGRQAMAAAEAPEASDETTAVATKVIESLGGKLECFYFAFGEDDAVMIYDLPDNVAAARASIAVNASGLIVSKTTPLLTVEEVDQALGAPDIGFRGPGQ